MPARRLLNPARGQHCRVRVLERQLAASRTSAPPAPHDHGREHPCLSDSSSTARRRHATSTDDRTKREERPKPLLL
jgi:hypothetical protein